MPEKVPFTIRFSAEDFRKLDESARVLGLTKTEAIRNAVLAQYGAVCENPETKKQLEKLQAMANFLRSLNGEQ